MKYQEGDCDFGLTEDIETRLEAMGMMHSQSLLLQNMNAFAANFLSLASVLPSLQFYTVTQ